MCLCAKGIDLASFDDFAVGLWNCSDSVVLFFSFFYNYMKLIKIKQNDELV